MTDIPFSLRAVQLDLARQMETPLLIRSVIDFAADNGFNAVVFYLEGRVRTESFPYPSEEESYSLEEMAELVAYAHQKGMQVIPVVSLLGHAEHFFRYSRELDSFAETRGGIQGRFGYLDKLSTFCPSQNEVYAFFQKYLGELCTVFTDPYFHVGCDESWDMGCCNLCRQRLEHGESQADLFEKHIQKIYRIVTGELGRRMIMWDDMLEYYPEVLEKLPRDILMACWQYQEHVDGIHSHFFNRCRRDALADYRRLGFEFLVCPADYTLRNAESFTAYATPYKPFGGLLTSWEKSDAFMLQSFPLMGCVGRLWESGGKDENGIHIESMAKALFGIAERDFLVALRAFMDGPLFLQRRATPENLFTCGESPSSAHSTRRNLVELLLLIFPKYLDEVRPVSRDVLREMMLTVQSEQFTLKVRELVPHFFVEGAVIETLRRLLEEVVIAWEAIAAERIAMWQKVRPGVIPNKMESLYSRQLGRLREIPTQVETRGNLRVHFFLPDGYSAQKVKISLRYAGDTSFEEIDSGVFKEPVAMDCYYARWFFVEKERVPEILRIETHGFGGQGFTWFEIRNGVGIFQPERIVRIQGAVSDPENLLVPDWRWAFAGERNTQRAYLHPKLAAEIHGFDVILKQVR